MQERLNKKSNHSVIQTNMEEEEEQEAEAVMDNQKDNWIVAEVVEDGVVVLVAVALIDVVVDLVQRYSTLSQQELLNLTSVHPIHADMVNNTNQLQRRAYAVA